MPDQLTLGEPLTEEQLRTLILWTEHYAKERQATLGKDYHEADFLAGAMVAFFAFNNGAKIPPMWVYGPMSGRPAFKD